MTSTRSRPVTCGAPRRKLSSGTSKGKRDMRHLVGIILAIVMAAVLFFAASWGYLKLVVGRTALGVLPSGGSLWHARAVVEGFGVLAAVGLAAGILVAVPRISPLAAGLPGLVL